MRVFLWVVQVALALLAVAGGATKVFKFDSLASNPAMGALSRSTWGVLGWFEMVCAILLILPAVARWNPSLTPFAAGALLLESVALAVIYSRFSIELTANNPLVWVVAMAVMAAFVAYERYPRTRG